MGPPATPAPSRFLLAKKQSTQTVHDANRSASQASAGPQQFRATPRFSASSTPRPSAGSATFSTPPILGFNARSSHGRSTQDIIDDSSPSSPQATLPESPVTQRQPEIVELDSSFISPLHSSQAEVIERSPKRRRISISPDVESSQPEPADDKCDVALDEPEGPEALQDLQERDNDPELVPSSLKYEDETASQEPEVVEVQDEDMEEDPITTQADLDTNHETESDVDILGNDTATKSQANPTFNTAPRFKAFELAANGPQEHNLPDAFSPHRGKYVIGGLAAELRDWVLEVKGHDADQQGASTAVGLAITSARYGGPDMTLVKGYRVPAAGDPDEDLQICAILAGKGRVSGLERTNTVVPGSTVMVTPPAWDVQLGPEKGTWTVACDWAVE